jgi:hypothetical protein
VSDEAAPTAVVRRLGREYGWLLAAVGLAALVLLCSLPFVDGAGMSWSSGDPFAAPAKVAPAATSGTPESGGPPTSAAPTTSASPSATAARAGAARRPAARTTSPTPKHTTPPAAAAPKAPVAVGPEGGAIGLWRMLREYCEATYRTDEAQLRLGTGQAEDNWECRRQGQNPLIDMNAACRREYGSAAFAQFSNRNDAFSWHCLRR